MKITSVQIIAYQLPLKQPWQTSRHVLNTRNGWTVKIDCDADLTGYGDCAPLPEAGTESFAKAQQHLTQQKNSLIGKNVTSVLSQLPRNSQTPASRFALETAFLDLLSQQKQQTLRQHLSPQAVNTILLNDMIGELSSDSHQIAKQAISRGFTILKIKLGLNTLDKDIRFLHQLAEQLPKQIKLRLDANCAWTYPQARQFIHAISDLNIDSIEEPLHLSEHNNIAKLQQTAPFSIALDESLAVFDKNELVRSQIAQRIIIKPTVIGGLLPALSLAELASAYGIETVVTSSIESAIGIQAVSQMTAALPVTENIMAHGLATGHWLMNNVTSAAEIYQAKMFLADAYGLGISPD